LWEVINFFFCSLGVVAFLLFLFITFFPFVSGNFFGGIENYVKISTENKVAQHDIFLRELTFNVTKGCSRLVEYGREEFWINNEQCYVGKIKDYVFREVPYVRGGNEGFYIYTPRETLKVGGDCKSQSFLFCGMASQVGIKCWTESGFNHRWSVVKLKDGSIIYVDATNNIMSSDEETFLYNMENL